MISIGGQENDRFPASCFTGRYRTGCLALAPDNGAARLHLAVLLAERGRPAEALAEYAALGGGDAGEPAVQSGFGQALISLGRLPEAEAPLRRSLDPAPDNLDCRWDRALALLQFGDYRRGFREYEARWGLKKARARRWPLPRWDGRPLAGRSLFLTDEQGLGDALQFARFIPQAKRLGAGKVVLECQPEMLRLMSLAAGAAAPCRLQPAAWTTSRRTAGH